MPSLSIKKKVRSLIITVYALMVLALLGSMGVALHQNWQLKLQSSQSEMARQAGIGNFIIEHAAINAAKALGNAQQSLQKSISSGAMNPLQVHETLRYHLNEHNAFINSDYKGLMLYINGNGLLQARTDHYPAEHFDFSDRVYFQRLRLNPTTNFTIGPLMQAQTTGEWVFHVAIPLRDGKNTFQGVLAQEIRLEDITQELGRYIDTSHATQIVTQTLDGHLALVYPPQLMTQIGRDGIDISYADFARRSSTPQDSFLWPPETQDNPERLVVGFELSEHFHLLTTAHRSLSDILGHFISESLFLIGFSLIALILLTLMLVRLSRVYDQFSEALHDSFSDTLTQIPNRRSLENIYPRLLRDSSRSQQALSVLFIDIDHFKDFNDDYGHDGGDIALKAVAHALQSCAKRPLDFVCRWGGEEFVIVLPHTKPSAAGRIAESILKAVRQIQLVDNNGRRMRQVTVSIGIACAVATTEQQGDHLILEADQAMQAAKKAGRDRYAVGGHTTA